jgi:DNA modification methylase
VFTREELLFFSLGDRYTFHPLHTDEVRGYAGWNKKYPAKSEYKRVTNVWTDIPELMRPKHKAEKPIQFMERVLRAHSNEGDMTVDLFAGSGAMGEACRGLRRRYIGCEKKKNWAAKADARVRSLIPFDGSGT